VREVSAEARAVGLRESSVRAAPDVATSTVGADSSDARMRSPARLAADESLVAFAMARRAWPQDADAIVPRAGAA
jgi:hypothetical protein